MPKISFSIVNQYFHHAKPESRTPSQRHDHWKIYRREFRFEWALKSSGSGYEYNLYDVSQRKSLRSTQTITLARSDIAEALRNLKHFTKLGIDFWGNANDLDSVSALGTRAVASVCAQDVLVLENVLKILDHGTIAPIRL